MCDKGYYMANRTTLNVSLPLEMGRFIARCVKSGRFSSASEVVRAGIRLLQVEEENARARKDHEPDASARSS